MASSAKKISLFLVVTLLCSLHTHARDSQFFNKIPSTTNNVVVPNAKEASTNQQEQQEPNFLPQNENSYGLYGHETGQNPPSTVAATTTTTTTPFNTEFKQPEHKYLPKNYNPVAYVTQPEDVNENASFNEERSFTTNSDDNNNSNNYYNGEQTYYNNQQQEEEPEEEAEFRKYPTANNNGNNYYYNGGSSFNSQPQGQSGATLSSRGNYFDNGGSSFNSQPQGQSDTEFRSGATLSNRENYFNNGGANGFQPQGMSDTRFMENGKYFYDVNTEKYSNNHPYQSLSGARPQNEYNNRNLYGNNANEFNNRNLYGNNANEFNSENSMGGFNNQEEFQYEGNMP